MNKIIADEVSENEKLMKSHTKAEELFGSSRIIMGEAELPQKTYEPQPEMGDTHQQAAPACPVWPGSLGDNRFAQVRGGSRSD